VYGNTVTVPASGPLGDVMVEYWVSFATSLDPNDRHGITSRKWLLKPVQA
jgi:hypothetical protein